MDICQANRIPKGPYTSSLRNASTAFSIDNILSSTKVPISNADLINASRMQPCFVPMTALPWSTTSFYPSPEVYGLKNTNAIAAASVMPFHRFLSPTLLPGALPLSNRRKRRHRTIFNEVKSECQSVEELGSKADDRSSRSSGHLDDVCVDDSSYCSDGELSAT
ncbi:hypothetical protein D917_05133 [Trichinella nativa]|uniref:Uncharacterized protein n=1 Tax=Trichinella nativa TaxID=6335 RepID=A0A1Y3F323_9BILA|nr:hypothetical protein D917_05133 [Trichinella nativa]